MTAQFSYSSLGANESYSVTLAPGASTELVIVVDRAAMTGAVGTLRANLLRITDSLNQTQQDLAVSAVIGTQHGLWSGMAIIDDVTQIEGSMAKKCPANFDQTNRTFRTDQTTR